MARTKSPPRSSTISKAPRKQLGYQPANKSLPNKDGMRKPLKYQSGADLREIRKYQKVTRLVTGKIPFQRLVREVAEKVKAGMQIKSEAVLALQIASEEYLVGLFANANLCAIHGKRVTVTLDDIHLAQTLKD